MQTTTNERLRAKSARVQQNAAESFIDRPMPRWKFILHCAWILPLVLGSACLFMWVLYAVAPGLFPA